MKKTFKYLIGFSLFFLACDNTADRNEGRLRLLEEKVLEIQSLASKLQKLEDSVKVLEQLPQPNKSETANADIIFSAKYRPSLSYFDDPFLGNKDANIIVMVFSDFQCVPCIAFAREQFKNLVEEFANSGKIKLIFRDLPLSSRENSRKASKLAQCAGEQDKYWEFFQILYNSADEIEQGEFELIINKAPELNTEQLNKCFESKRYTAEIDKDIEEAKELGARGAPSTFIGKLGEDQRTFEGVFVRGAQPYEVFKQQITQLLGS
jgi:protein-disulfide isomerase